MKKLLLALMVLATLASCGKDNKVSSTTANGLTVTNPIVTGSTTAQSLINMINSPTSFGQGQVVSSGSQQNCGTKWGFIYYCTTSSSGGTSTGKTWAQAIAENPGVTFQYSSGRTVRNIDINITTKQQELINLLNAATNIQSNGPIYYVTTASGQYVIDTRYVIQVNPSATISSGVNEYFMQAL